MKMKFNINKNIIKFNNKDKITKFVNFVSCLKLKIFNSLLKPNFCNEFIFTEYIKNLITVEKIVRKYIENEFNETDIEDNIKTITEFKKLIHDTLYYLKNTLQKTNNFQNEFDYISHLEKFLINNEILSKYYYKRLQKINKNQQKQVIYYSQLFNQQTGLELNNYQTQQKPKIKKPKIIKTTFQEINQFNIQKLKPVTNFPNNLKKLDNYLPVIFKKINEISKNRKINYSDIFKITKEYILQFGQQIVNNRFKNIGPQVIHNYVIQKYNEELLNQLSKELNNISYTTKVDFNKLKQLNIKTNKYKTIIISKLYKLKIDDSIKGCDIILNIINDIFPIDVIIL